MKTDTLKSAILPALLGTSVWFTIAFAYNVNWGLAIVGGVIISAAAWAGAKLGHS